MREKCLFAGLLVLSVLYCVEVFSRPALGPLQWVGLALVAVTIIPWIVSQILAMRKRRRRKAEEAALRQMQKSRKQERG